MPRKKKLPFPEFKDDKEEIDFWETHSVLDYEVQALPTQLEMEPDARSIPINLRLPRWLVNDLKALAQEEGVPYQRLIRQGLIRFVESAKQGRNTESQI